MSDPTLTFQIAFASKPGDDPLTWTTVPGTKTISYGRGAPNEYGQAETGESQVVIGDRASALDPNNAGELVNLCANPSFETSLWPTVLGADTATLGTLAKWGDRSMRIAPTGALSGRSLGVTGLTAGGTYTVSGWIYVESIGAGKVNLDFVGTGIDTQLIALNAPNGGFVRYSQTFTLPAGTTAGTLRFFADGAAPVCVAYLDGVQLEEAAAASDYCDGDQDNCRWAGAAHESQSYRGGPYYPNVKRMKAMRAYITVSGVDYPLFSHFIERLPRSASIGSVWTERALTGVDGFAWLALASLKGRSYGSEASGTRWTNVLNDIGWPAARRSIDAGNSTLDPAVFDGNASTKALEHLLSVVDSENGFGFMDAAGDARFIERHAAITDTTLKATFADGRSLATGSYIGALPYTELQPESTEVVNDYSGARDGGATITASDATSIDDYGPRSQELTFLIDSDLEVQDALNWKLAQTKDPAERIDAITVMPGYDLARWVTVLGLEVGDRILVVEWPPGYAAPVETQFLIRHLAASLPLPLEGAAFTFQLTPASADSWFVLDDATAGELDSNKLAY